MTLPLDRLKRPIKVGDTVLCKGYGSCSHNTFTTVLRVNPKSVTISNSYHALDRDSAGKWVYKPSTKTQNMIEEDLLRHSFPQLSDDDWFTIGDMPNFRTYPLPTLVSWLRGFREGLSLEDSRSTYPEDFL